MLRKASRVVWLSKSELKFIEMMKVVIAAALVLDFIVAYGGAAVQSFVQRTDIKLELSPKSGTDPLIHTKHGDTANVKMWTDTINTFLQDYKWPPSTEEALHNIVNCDFDYPPRNGSFCTVDMRSFGPCSPGYLNKYGFDRRTPCVFLTPNKVLNWTPEPYTLESLPANMTEDLKELIRNAEHKSMIWLTCEGELPADKEFIGSIKYYPTRGFPAYFYPYTGVEGYLSPVIAVHFERATPGILIGVECRIWAQNIPYDRERQLGSVRFQLLLD